MTETTTRLPMEIMRFDSGMIYDEYVANMENNQKRIKQMFAKYELTSVDIASIQQAVEAHGGQIYVTVLVEDWCPDVSLNVPVLAHMANAVDGFDLRLFIRSENTDLQDAYKALDIYTIPTVTIFDANWQVIGHWAERSQPAHQQINQWMAETYPNIAELKKSDKAEDKEALQKINASRFATMLKWYRSGLWRDTLTEILELMS